MHVTVSFVGGIPRTYSVPSLISNLRIPPTDDEIHSMLESILKLLVLQIPDKTAANIKATVEPATFNLSVN